MFHGMEVCEVDDCRVDSGSGGNTESDYAQACARPRNPTQHFCSWEVRGSWGKEWREANPELATSGNMRDHADLIQLNVLANLESLNSVMIEAGTSKEKRFDLLRKTAISQYKRLSLYGGAKGVEGFWDLATSRPERRGVGRLGDWRGT